MLGLVVALFIVVAIASFIFMGRCIKNEGLSRPECIDKTFAAFELAIVGLVLLALVIGEFYGY